jgi:hypothetical protein
VEKQGRCDIHGIWLGTDGQCHFCLNKNAQVRQGTGTKVISGGGEKKGVKTMSKETQRGRGD